MARGIDRLPAPAVQLSWAALLLLLAVAVPQFAAGASHLEASPPSPWNRPRKWMRGMLAAEPFSSNATAASTNKSTEPPPPTPEQEPDWLLGDDDKTASTTTPKMLLAILLPAVAGVLGGIGLYKVFKARLECFNNNCTNIKCCIC